MSKRRSLSIVFAVFLLATVAVASVAAQTRTPGVSVGDQFKYGDIDIQWSSDNPNATISSGLEMLNKTEYFTLSVEGVSGTNVTCEITNHFQNGTEKTEQGYIDVESGDSKNITFIPLPFISKDLQENDLIYTSEAYAGGKINETVTRTYPDGTRETNHINITTEMQKQQQYYFSSTNYYWDKTTGTLVEFSQGFTSQAGGYTTTSSLSVSITQSNKWTIPEFPFWISLPLFMVATLLTAIVARRKLKAMPDRKE